MIQSVKLKIGKKPPIAKETLQKIINATFKEVLCVKSHYDNCSLVLYMVNGDVIKQRI